MINFVDCNFDALCIVLCIPFGVVCMYVYMYVCLSRRAPQKISVFH